MNYISPSHRSYLAQVSGYSTASTSRRWVTPAPGMCQRREPLTSCSPALEPDVAPPCAAANPAWHGGYDPCLSCAGSLSLGRWAKKAFGKIILHEPNSAHHIVCSTRSRCSRQFDVGGARCEKPGKKRCCDRRALLRHLAARVFFLARSETAGAGIGLGLWHDLMLNRW
jgi:hypothetical protein